MARQLSAFTGLAPCAILIWIWSALTRYSVVTPNRPEATCLIAERSESPALSSISRSIRRLADDVGQHRAARDRRKRRASPPPSPVFDLPPIRFMAIASVVCAFGGYGAKRHGAGWRSV